MLFKVFKLLMDGLMDEGHPRITRAGLGPMAQVSFKSRKETVASTCLLHL